jgi:hypothetical protein
MKNRLLTAGLFAASGAALLKGIWVSVGYNYEPIWWVWYTAGALCSFVAILIGPRDNLEKLKISVPALLMGAAALLTGWGIYYGSKNEAPFLFAGITVLLGVIVYLLIKPRQQTTA